LLVLSELTLACVFLREKKDLLVCLS
jgi:hypothetical protein